ncbi:hypothetical protein GCM10010346_59230 [Streptomyces chryseus]|uniref:Uncharacterized protein n=1 Tax=Streptomyces chryseus TaxID=68186 RepID=A0ABQ3E6N8_9ACTN|nr:hypothetical protein GCM10010346_59230 [Streptomyces chryseus]
MDAALAALRDDLELEVLDGVGDVGVVRVDPRLVQGPRQHLAGGTDERPALSVLLVAGPLAEQQHSGDAPEGPV